MSISTPVAFIIFNRPDLTNIVFEAIRQAKPQKLLVIADGPRFPEEVEKCQKARAVIHQIDWECELLTNFSETNMGCKRRVSSGLDWVFSVVEEAIILEDDCLPAPSFFNFCETLLERYRDDERVTMIGGTNYQQGESRTEASYYFSKYMHVWGWASWKRAWRHYDVDIKTWPEYKKQNAISLICQDAYEQKYWKAIFDEVYEGKIDTWDYQWVYTCWSQNGLSIIPNSNLVSNLGFRSDATHVPCESPWANLPITDIELIKHPLFIYRNKVADDYTFDYHYGGNSMRDADKFVPKVKRKIRFVYNSFKNNLRQKLVLKF